MKKTAIALLLASSLIGIADPARAQTTDDSPIAAQETSVDQWLEGELAQSGGLTAAEVARRASQSSFDVAKRRAELSAAAADLDRAVAAYLPKTQLSARYTRLSDMGTSNAGAVVMAPGAGSGPIAPGTTLVNVPLEFPSVLNQYAFQASLTVPVSDYFTRIPSNHAVAEYSEKSARATLAGTERQVAADAKIAYYSWLRARLSVVVSEQALGMARAHRDDAELQFQSGNASKADVLRVESEVAQAEQVLFSAKNLARITEEQLRVAMHDQGSSSYRVGEDIRSALPRFGSDERSLWSRAIERRPELAGYRHAERARRHAADVERASILPRVDVFANKYYSNPNPRVFPQKDEFRWSWDFGAQLTWSLSDVPGALAAGRAQDARAAAIRAEGRALADRIRIEVLTALEDAKKADFALATSARQLAAAEESYRVRRVAFQNGRATSVELIDSETTLTRARFDALAARIDARVARVRLGYAVGDDLRRDRR